MKRSSDTITMTDVIAMSLQDGIGVDGDTAKTLAESIMQHAARLGLGGMPYYVPKAYPPAIEARNSAIHADRKAGKPVIQIAAESGLTRVHIWRILRNVT
jgi:Mor family transcriptional regulator